MTVSDDYWKLMSFAGRQSVDPRGFAVAIPPPRMSYSYREGFAAMLLSRNPHFDSYVQLVRQVLGLPQAGIRGLEPEVDPTRPAPWSQFSIDSMLLANLWLELHRSKAMDLPYEGPVLPDFLPQWLLDYNTTSNTIALDENKWPAWLHKEPKLPEFNLLIRPFVVQFPLQQFVGVLLRVFRLPASVFERVSCYVLTGDKRWIEFNTNPLRVETYMTPLEGGGTRLVVAVEGIDLSTPKSQWDEVWQQVIEPLLRAQYASGRWQDRKDSPIGSGSALHFSQIKELSQRPRPSHRPYAKLKDVLPIYDMVAAGVMSVEQALEPVMHFPP